MAAIKCKVPVLRDAVRHFGVANHAHIIPISGAESDEEVPRSLLLPQKWAAELVDAHMLPGEFLEFVRNKTKTWSDADQDGAKFLTTWALAACGATNKTAGGKGASQLGLPLADFDLVTDTFDEWTEARLV